MLVRSAIFNKARKSFGNTTAVSYVDNQTIIKSKISDPTNPNTPAQQLRRSIFSGIQLFCKAALPHIQQFFMPTAINRSPYSSAMRAGLLGYQGAASYDPNDFSLEPAKQISNGNLQPVELFLDDSSVEVKSSTANFDLVEFSLEWEDDNWWPTSGETDLVELIVVQPTGNYYRKASGSHNRSAGEGSFEVALLKDHRTYAGLLVTDTNGNVSVQFAPLVRDDSGDWNPALTVI